MFARTVRAGLGNPGQKQLPCEYFYDAVGSALFDAITLLPEYGLTRADVRLIRGLTPELDGYLRRPITVVELGSGSGSKTRWVLESLARSEPVTYYPIDVSAAALARCVQELASLSDVIPIEDSYLSGLRQAICRRPHGHSMLILFLGSAIGNFEANAARDFLGEIRSYLMPGDALLLGTDLVKPVEQMVAAYDDATGVTAAFNLNLLGRINRELDGNFVLRNFEHEARWNAEWRRIEMHLRSRVAQRVCIPKANFHCDLREGETIWTESCHKFELGEIGDMAAEAGFACAAQWVDREWPFAESLLTA